MKRVILSIILLFNIVCIHAQSVSYSSFEKWMPKPTAPYVLKSTAYCESYHGGNTWVVFQVDSMQGSTIRGRHIWLMRMDMEGNNLWSKKLVCTNWDYVQSIVSTPDDGVLITGFTPNGGYTAGWLCKTDKDGDIQWARKYQESTPYTSTYFRQSIYKDGYYYVSGGRSLGSAPLMFLTKIDTLGNMIWSKHYKEDVFNYYLEPYYITTTNKNEIIIAGSIGVKYVSILKTDTAGNIILNKAYTSIISSLNPLLITQLVPIKDKLYASFNQNVSNLVVLDSLGTILWSRCSNILEYFFSIQKDDKIITGGIRGSSFIHGTTEINPRKYENTSTGSFFNCFYTPIYKKTNAAISVSGQQFLSQIRISKIDTSMTFECPVTSIINKDSILVRDTTSAFSVIVPSYTATVLGGFRSEPLNLQWTFECGKIAPSSVIHQNKPVLNFVVYPNPAQEAITIRTDLKNYDIRVWDSYGKLLHNVSNIQQSDYTFPIQYLPQGTYHIECIANNQHYVQPFVKIQ